MGTCHYESIFASLSANHERVGGGGEEGGLERVAKGIEIKGIKKILEKNFVSNNGNRGKKIRGEKTRKCSLRKET